MIALLGHSDFGLEVLKKILSKKINISYVTTKKYNKNHTDKSFIDFKNICADNDIPLLINRDVNDKDIIKFNMEKKVKFVIIGGYDGILKKPFISSVKKVINTHFGIIPRNRGCNPTIWDILSSKKGGYTTYEVNENIDLGKIIEQREIDYNNDVSSEQLYKLILSESLLNYDKIIDNLTLDKLKFISPRKMANKYHSKDMPNDRYISWNWKTEFINRIYRSLKFGNYPTIRSVDFKDRIIELNPIKFGTDFKDKPGNFKKNRGFTRIFSVDGYVDVLNQDIQDPLKNIEQGKYSIPTNFKGTFFDDTNI